MYRPFVMAATPTQFPQWWCQEKWARLLVPFTLWLCVSVGLRYGYYTDCRMVVGPSSSRLMKASSLFVEKVEVSDDDGKGVGVYGFAEKPELSSEAIWNVSKYLIVGPYGRKGFSLWLNRGSKLRLRLETQPTQLNQLQVFMIKGERYYEILQPIITNESLNGKETEYKIEENDKYYVSVVNVDPKSTIMLLSINVTSKVYEVSNAKDKCSMTKGSCHLKFTLPNTRYVVVTTPNNNGDLGGSYIKISFVARILTYLAILGVLTVVMFLIMKLLGAFDVGNTNDNNVIETTRIISDHSILTDENIPLMTEKIVRLKYGTGDKDDDDVETRSNNSSSSEELYDAKLCVICYDDQRNCFFVPCGHSATCYDCAQRIMDGEGKMCPICRRLVHKVRRLFV